MKIKIKSLPEGMSLEDGNIKSMQDGGASTGDQLGYGLTTIPTTVSGSQINDDNDKDVRYSLSSVPREEANIEAEGGETVLTDLNNDGNFGLYNITGPRHSSGGVPMFLPEQSFIYSDTKALKMKGEELKEFGIQSRKSKTPADVSKKYQLNKFYGAIEDEYADDIQVKSAELMLKKNKFDLSKLAFGQELKKDFEEGVPLAAHPYLTSIGEDPIAFTAKVEQINEQKAQQRAFEALPPEQQQQIMMLQQMMAQAQQQPEEGMTPPSPEGQVNLAQAELATEPGMGDPMAMGDPTMMGEEIPMAQFGGGRRNRRLDNDGDGIPNSQDPYPFDPYNGRGSGGIANQNPNAQQPLIGETQSEYLLRTTGNPGFRNNTAVWDGTKFVKGTSTTTIIQPEQGTDPIETSLVGGSPEYLEYYDSDQFADARNLRYEAYVKGTESAGRTPVSADDYHKYYKEAQRRNFEIYKFATENPDLFNSKGYSLKSEGLDKNYSLDADGGYATEELRGIIDLYNTTNKDQPGFVPLTVPSKQETITFQQGYINNLQQQGIEEYRKMINGEEHDEEILGSYFTDGVDDEGDVVLNPAWKEGDNPQYKYMKGVSKADFWYGNTTLGQKDQLNITKTYKPTEVTITEEEDFVPPDVAPPKPLPNADFWLQDLVKMNAIANRERELFLPWQPEVEDVQVNYDVIDPTRTIAAINEQNSILMNANNMYSGAQAGSARNSAAVGKTMKAVADAVNDIQAKNVGIVNRGEYQNAMIDMKINRERRDRNVKEYDDTVTALQTYMDEKNFDREQYADAYANALTNRANTYNMNLTQDYFNIDPMTGGMIGQVGARAFDAVQPVDQQEAFLNSYAKLKRNLGADFKMTPEMVTAFMNMGASSTPQQTNIQREYQNAMMNPYTNPFGYPGNNTNMTTLPGYNPGKRGGEKKLKRMAVPFYSGSMLP